MAQNLFIADYFKKIAQTKEIKASMFHNVKRALNLKKPEGDTQTSLNSCIAGTGEFIRDIDLSAKSNGAAPFFHLAQDAFTDAITVQSIEFEIANLVPIRTNPHLIGSDTEKTSISLESINDIDGLKIEGKQNDYLYVVNLWNKTYTINTPQNAFKHSYISSAAAHNTPSDVIAETIYGDTITISPFSVNVITIEQVCGDEVCSFSESCDSCSQDCGSCSNGCTCDIGCDTATTQTAPFVVDGADTNYCFFFEGTLGSFMNNWNNDKVTINGEDYTNTWTNTYPSMIDGGYYLYYHPASPWSHIEVK